MASGECCCFAASRLAALIRLQAGYAALSGLIWVSSDPWQKLSMPSPSMASGQFGTAAKGWNVCLGWLILPKGSALPTVGRGPPALLSWASNRRAALPRVRRCVRQPDASTALRQMSGGFYLSAVPPSRRCPPLVQQNEQVGFC
jgi:hypothetical protein